MVLSLRAAALARIWPGRSYLFGSALTRIGTLLLRIR